MLDARSGRLLATKSFNQAFSQLQFARQGLSFLLHKSNEDAKELIELHHFDLVSNSSTVVTSFLHNPQANTRPSQWRGSISRDGSILVYQPDVLQPSINVVDGLTGTPIAQICWQGDFSALPVHIDPANERIVVPLAQWDARYSFGTARKVLVASLKTGAVLGTYDVNEHINQVRFQDNRIVLMDHANHVGQLEIGSTAIAWKPLEVVQDNTKNHFVYHSSSQTGVLSKANTQSSGVFTLLGHDHCASKPSFTLEAGFTPVGLRSGMLVSEKHSAHELPAWVHKINKYSCSLFGRYLVSPSTYTRRYEDAATGQLRAVQHISQKHGEAWQAHRIAGSARYATISIDSDHLNVEMAEVFPFWNAGSILLLALVLTLILMTFRTARMSRRCTTAERNGNLLPSRLQSSQVMQTSCQA